MLSTQQQCIPKPALRSEMIGLFWFFLGWACGLPLTLIGTSLIGRNTICRHICGTFVTFTLCLGFMSIATCAYVYGRHIPKRPVGRHVKLATYLTTFFAAILMRWCLAYSLENLAILVFSFLEVLVIWKLCHGVTDINFCEALMVTTMEVAAYEAFKKPYFIVVFVCCGGVIFCRCWFYSSPETCSDLKEDLELAHSLVEPPKS